MLSHDDIIQRTLENAGHRKRQINIYVQVCFPQLTFQRMLISYKIPVHMYNVVPDKISRIMHLNHVLKPEQWKMSHCMGKPTFGIGFTEEAKWIYHTHTRIQRSGPPALEIHKFYINICPPPCKNLDPLPCKMLEPLWKLNKNNYNMCYML